VKLDIDKFSRKLRGEKTSLPEKTYPHKKNEKMQNFFVVKKQKCETRFYKFIQGGTHLQETKKYAA
jgi:hypothetical protein